MKTYTLEQFEGPLDLLLKMIQQEELDITQVSLATIAEEFVQYIQDHPNEIHGQELADFLVVATQLLLLKSQLLLPDLKTDEELHPETLETQLKLYRRFIDAAAALQLKLQEPTWLFARTKSAYQPKPRFSPPEGVQLEQLANQMQAVIARLEPIVILPESTMEKTVTLQEKMRSIHDRLKSAKGLSFRSLLNESRSKIEQIVSFLALLELVKQEEVEAQQSSPFDDILISKAKAASKES